MIQLTITVPLTVIVKSIFHGKSMQFGLPSFSQALSNFYNVQNDRMRVPISYTHSCVSET